jgi:hypothetical protein
MANDRVSRATAELVPLPPHTWYVKTISWLLEQPKVKENIKSVPLNKNLMDSLSEHGMLSPILTMPNWYPIAGSQRMRCMAELVPTNPWLGDQEIRVCRIDKEYWLVWYLWGEKDFRDKAVAIYFQMVELVWKSMYYEEAQDPSGKLMTDFEKEGDELEWNHKSELGQARIKAKRLKDLIKTPLEPSINKDGKSS